MVERLLTRLRLRRVLDAWTGYHDLITNSLGDPIASQTEETRFLRIKAEVAGAIPFLASISPVELHEESQRSLAKLDQLLRRHRTLVADQPLNPVEREAFEEEWHDLYIFLCKLRGASARGGGSRERAAGLPAGGGWRGRPAVGRGAAAGWKWFGNVAAFAVKLLLIGVLLFLLGRTFGFHGVDSRPALDAPSSAEGALRNFSGALQELAGGVSQTAQPFLSSYGMLAAAVAGLALLLGLGYWVFARG